MKRPRQHVTDTEASRIFDGALPAEWVVREPQSDYGVDREIEVFSRSRSTGFTFKAQIKGTRRPKVSCDGATVFFSLRTPNARYLCKELATPTLLAVVDVTTRRIWWNALQTDQGLMKRLDRAEHSEQGHLVVHIPATNVLPATRDAMLDAMKRAQVQNSMRCVVHPDNRKYLSEYTRSREGAIQRCDGIAPLPKNFRSFFRQYMLQEAVQKKHTKSAPHGRPSTRLVLSISSYRSLALIAATRLTTPTRMLTLLLPSVNWTREMRTWQAAGLLVKDNNCLRIPSSVSKRLLSEKKEFDSAHRTWIRGLRPLRQHVDMALRLALHYMALKQDDAAVVALAGGAENAYTKSWNDLYLRVLTQASHPRMLRRLRPESRTQLLRARGDCLFRAGKHQEALAACEALYHHSRRFGNAWGMGQSHFRRGAVFEALNNSRLAEEYYLKAIDCATRHGDKELLARALHDLGVFLCKKHPARASLLLRKSKQVSCAEGNRRGVIAATIAQGNLQAQQHEYNKALRCYREAEGMARSKDFLYDRVLARHNIGSALCDLGNPKSGLASYRKARMIAEAGDCDDGIILALRGEVIIDNTLGLHKRAEFLARRLLALAKRSEDSGSVLTALCSLAYSCATTGKRAEARRLYRAATTTARHKGDHEAVTGCLINRAMVKADAGHLQMALAELRKSAIDEEHAMPLVAGRIWEAYADSADGSTMPARRVENAYARSLRCYRKASADSTHLLRVYRALYAWRWRRGAFKKALMALDTVVQIASRTNEVASLVDALNEKGVCLQLLGRNGQAKAPLVLALHLARKLKDDAVTENVLNNYGELSRKMGALHRAAELLAAAERIARRRHDARSALSIASNRVLVLTDMQQSGAASRLLRSIREVARRKKIWSEYVRSLHDMAKLAQFGGNAVAAERHYKAALSAARLHRVSEQYHAIALNYAWLLINDERFAPAARILRPLENEYFWTTDAHLYYKALAQASEGIGDARHALYAWEQARLAASRVGDKGTWALACAAIAEVCQQPPKRNWKRADALLAEAVRNEEDPIDRGGLLFERIKCNLALGNEKHASKLSRQVRALAVEKNIKDLYIDLHMAIADHNWSKQRGRLSAMQAYAVAMLKALEVKGPTLGTIYLHVLQQLHRIRTRRVYCMAALQKRLIPWLCRQLRVTAEDPLCKIVLLPFSLAEKLTPLSNNWSKIPQQQFSVLIQQEIDAILRLNKSKALSAAGGGPPLGVRRL